MTVSSWVPYLLGVVLVALGIPIAYFLPETLHRHPGADPYNGEPFRHTLRLQFGQLIRSTRFLWTGNILLALSMFLATILSRQSTTLLLQYSSMRYDWPIARASLYLSLRGAITLFTFAVVMPAAHAGLSKILHVSSATKDRLMSQASGVLSILGFVVTAEAATPFVYIVGIVLMSLGSAFIVTTRSLATSLVRPDQVARLYSAAAVVQSIGALLAGPLFAKLFAIGLRDACMGLPFILAGVLFGVATLAASLLRPLARGEAETEPLLGDDTA